MATDSQAKEKTGNLPANRMRLSDKVKSMSKGIRMFMYNEYTEDKGGTVEVAEAEKDGSIVGRYVKKDGKTVETSASSDAQMSGDHAKMASAAGVKKDEIRSTTPIQVARDMSPKKDQSDLAEGPAELGATSDKQADTPNKPEQNEKAKPLPTSKPTESNNTDKIATGKKPDGSLFKPKGEKAPGDEGDFKADKAKPLVAQAKHDTNPKGGKPDKSMGQMASIKSGPTSNKDNKLEKAYEIKAEPGKITYTQKDPSAMPGAPKPEVPNWKKRWDQKPAADKSAFSQHLANQRQMYGKPTGPKQPAGGALKKDDEHGERMQRIRASLDKINQLMAAAKKAHQEGKPGVQALVTRADNPKAPRSRDEKIDAALARHGRGQARSGAPAPTRPEPKPAPKQEPKRPNPLKEVPAAEGPKKGGLRAQNAAMRDASDNAKTENAKPILLKDMARYKKFTASGRPFRVMMGTHPDHRSMVGAHHVLEAPATINQVDAELKKPTSELSRRVYDAIDQGHDTLLVHQPSQGEKQHAGHLRVMKSIQDNMEKLQKNVLEGYGSADQTGMPAHAADGMNKAGWQPTPHPSDPRIMNKAGDSHAQHALQFAQRTRRWIAGRKGRMDKAKQDAAEQQLDQHTDRHMRKAATDPTQAPKAPETAHAPGVPSSHSPKIRAVADAYAHSKGMKLNHGIPHAEVNPEHAGKIAQAYHAMPHSPNDPHTKRAYDALVNETADQFKHMKATGLKTSKIEPGMENPYKSSKDMIRDIHENNHMWYFPTEQGFGSGGEASDHPLLRQIDTPEGPMAANDMFRMVHDYFGHAKEGHGFGPKGEENAWRHHMQMYSPEAQKALTSETRGQNSWVNFGPHGENNRKNPHKTIYADQKAGLLPEWALK